MKMKRLVMRMRVTGRMRGKINDTLLMMSIMMIFPSSKLFDDKINFLIMIIFMLVENNL